MSKFKVHTIESAPEAAKPVLEQVRKAYGMLPNLFGVFAAAPPAANSYLTLTGEFSDTDFSETERQVILLTTSFENNCDYCMAAHSAIAEMAKVPEDVVEALRSGSPIAGPKLEALRRFTAKMVTSRGSISEADREAFFAAGYTERHVLEVILGITLKTLSNYTNHVAGTPLDEAFTSQRWEKPETVKA